MKKFWLVAGACSGTIASNKRLDGNLAHYGPFFSKKEATDEMKRRAAADERGSHEYFVLEAILGARRPVPDIDVTELKS